jgi:hypothetical protein
MRAFVSYSHKDEKYLDRLHTHLAVLRRDGMLQSWYDRDILAGDHLGEEVQRYLHQSELFLALVSPDFLASDYCYDAEMESALKVEKSGEIRIVPIILEPCDWLNSPLKSFLALPKDGRAISTWENPNLAYLDVVTQLRRTISSRRTIEGHSGSSPKSQSGKAVTHSVYRAKRDFTAVDKARFRKECYARIRDFFARSAQELDSIGNPFSALFEEIDHVSFTCTVVNRAKNGGEAHIMVRAEGGRSGWGDIVVSYDAHGRSSSINASLNIEEDEYEMHLRYSGALRNDSKEHVSAERAAQLLWVEMCERADITVDPAMRIEG